VQDLWPEAFKMVFNMPIFSNILFFPIKKQADYIYAAADEIIAVSQTYVDRALQVNKKAKKGYSIFLGTELQAFDRFAKDNAVKDKPEGEIWIGYVGTLGHSYDLTSVIDALAMLQKKGIKNIKFIVMGDGPLKTQFEKQAKANNVYVEFTGRLDYGKMVGLLNSCDIAVNPISKGAASSIINKHADYAAAGLPIINTQECQEYRDLISQYEAGLNCDNNNAEDLADKILLLYKNKSMRIEMGKNSRKMAEDKFDRRNSYPLIVKLLK
jgi:glycosyltransferase involved in cell wall biosynthesis